MSVALSSLKSLEIPNLHHACRRILYVGGFSVCGRRLVSVISRWPVYRGGRYIGLIAGLSDECVLGGRYIKVTVISRQPLYRGGCYSGWSLH